MCDAEYWLNFKTDGGLVERGKPLISETGIAKNKKVINLSEAEEDEVLNGGFVFIKADYVRSNSSLYKRVTYDNRCAGFQYRNATTGEMLLLD